MEGDGLLKNSRYISINYFSYPTFSFMNTINFGGTFIKKIALSANFGAKENELNDKIAAIIADMKLS